MEGLLGNRKMVHIPEEVNEYLRWVKGIPLTKAFGEMEYRYSVGFEFLCLQYGQSPQSIYNRGQS